LEPRRWQYNFYIIGIGIGTLAGNAIFIFGGKWMVGQISNSERYLNWVIGAIFAITALVQLWKILRHKDAVEQLTKANEGIK
jgi:putative Ca2+/H+ antiporter (TMEM165/GDT1 family)